MLEDGAAPDDGRCRLATTTLAFLAAAFHRGNGRFRNFMSHSRVWLEEAGSEDSHGRAVWALGVDCGRSHDDGHRLLCQQLFHESVAATDTFTSPRAWAFTMLGIHEYLKAYPGDAGMQRILRSFGHRLVSLWQASVSPGWRWFESILSYDNARIPQALIAAGERNPAGRMLGIALESLRWLARIQTAEAGHFRPVGSNGFYPKGGERADFDQQPLEAHAMVSACLEAGRVTGDPT